MSDYSQPASILSDSKPYCSECEQKDRADWGYVKFFTDRFHDIMKSSLVS